MRVLSLYTPAATTAHPPSPEHMAEMGKLGEEMTRAGVLIATGACLSGAASLHMRAADGKVTVTEGAAPRPGDPVIGFALLEVKSKPELFQVVERFLKVAGDGECELRVLV